VWKRSVSLSSILSLFDSNRTLAGERAALKKAWAPMSRIWDARIAQRIAELKQLKIDIVNLRAHEGARAQSLGKVQQHKETAPSRRK
jgi:hypothetical protein